MENIVIYVYKICKHDSWVCTRWQAKVLKSEELSFAKLSDWLWDIPHLLAKGHRQFLSSPVSSGCVVSLTINFHLMTRLRSYEAISPFLPHTFKVWFHLSTETALQEVRTLLTNPDCHARYQIFRVTMAKTRVFWNVIMSHRVPDVSKVRVATILKNDQITFSCFIRSHTINAGSKMGCPTSCSSVTHSHSC